MACAGYGATKLCPVDDDIAYQGVNLGKAIYFSNIRIQFALCFFNSPSIHNPWQETHLCTKGILLASLRIDCGIGKVGRTSSMVARLPQFWQ